MVNHWLLPEIASIVNYRVPITTRLGNGMKVRVGWNDFIGRHILRHGYYEPETVTLIERLLAPGQVFADVGAHIGQYTLIASRLVGSVGEVHSFEPDPETFRWLQNNVRSNHCKNVRLNQMALSDEKGMKQLFIATPEDIGSNSLAPPLNGSGRACEVSTTTLDDYLRENKVERVDLLKADIEGAEYSLLSGATALLSSEQKPVLILEFEEKRQKAFGFSCAQLAEFLTNRGYSLFRVGASGLEPYVPKHDDAPTFNVLGVPETKASLLHNLRHAGLLSEAATFVGE